MARLTRRELIKTLIDCEIGEEFEVDGAVYFRIDKNEFKVYPPGTTDLDNGAYFTAVYLIPDEFPILDDKRYFSVTKVV